MKPYGCLCFCDVIASRGHNGWSRQRNLNSYSSSFLFIFFTETKEKKENRVFELPIWLSLTRFHLVQSRINEMWISLFFPSLLSYIYSYSCTINTHVSWQKKRLVKDLPYLTVPFRFFLQLFVVKSVWYECCHFPVILFLHTCFHNDSW